MNPIPQTMEEVNFMGRQGYQGHRGNYGQGRQYQPQGTYQSQGGGSSYNPNARKHENFSYSNPKAAVQYPPGFEPGAKPPNSEGRPSTDEMLSLIYKEMKEKDAKGKFPSNTEPNPKEHCKAIELRSGTRYQGPPLPNEHDEEEKKDETEQENVDDKVGEKDEDEEIAPSHEDEEEKGMMKNDKEEMKKK
ncbi:hypothetical protein ACS0TY_021835 [Phlomoides rotata]